MPEHVQVMYTIARWCLTVCARVVGISSIDCSFVCMNKNDLLLTLDFVVVD